MSYAKVAELVRGVLKMKARTGETTKSEATLLTWKKMEKAGGPTSFGIGRAAMQVACMHIIRTEVMRQFKGGLSDHERMILLPTAPDDFKEVLGKVQQWIAIEEGEDARRVYWRKASRDQWLANAELKELKAQQTIAKANQSKEIVLFLERYGLATLGAYLGGE